MNFPLSDHSFKEREASIKTAEEHAAEIAMGNPLLNLAAALGQTPKATSVGGTFAVKKRWDDGMPPAIDPLRRLTEPSYPRSGL